MRKKRSKKTESKKQEFINEKYYLTVFTDPDLADESAAIEYLFFDAARALTFYDLFKEDDVPVTMGCKSLMDFSWDLNLN